jgi:hypothetical protein
MSKRVKTLTDESPFPFGDKYGGKPMRDVPAWYLDLAVDWRCTRDRYPEVIDYVNRNRKALDAELKEQGRI